MLHFIRVWKFFKIPFPIFNTLGKQKNVPNSCQLWCHCHYLIFFVNKLSDAAIRKTIQGLQPHLAKSLSRRHRHHRRL